MLYSQIVFMMSVILIFSFKFRTSGSVWGRPSNRSFYHDCLQRRNRILSRIKDKLYGIESTFIKKPFLEHSDKTNKVKRNLTIISLIVIVMTVLDISISNVSLIGVRVTGITESKLLVILLVLLIYHLVFFIWQKLTGHPP